MLENATVNVNLGFDDVCKEKYAIIGYNDEYWVFSVDNITGIMREFPPVTPKVSFTSITQVWLVEKTFFSINHIEPKERIL